MASHHILDQAYRVYSSALTRGLTAGVASALLVGSFSLHGQTTPGARQFVPGSVRTITDLPLSRLRTRLERLPEVGRRNALERLRHFHFPELDLDSLEVDEEGALFYADHFDHHPPLEKAEVQMSIPKAAIGINPFPADSIFHSKPGAPNILYLDFTGENVTNTAWNTSLGRSTIPAVAFSSDSDFTTFSDSERQAIRRVWLRVAEDYAPFNIDVTTERPVTFGNRTAHVVITRNTDANGASNPSSGAGGVAYVDTFGSSSYARYRPAWVYANNLSSSESLIAEAVSHEIGHNMGLSHDGQTGGTQYYSGHGSGETSWGPIMGTGYNRNVSQWSRGEYHLANNTQDDLAIISGKTPYRNDDHGNTAQGSTPLVFTGTNIVSTTPESDPENVSSANKGMFERNNDVDVFSFTAGSGPLRLVINPWVMPAGTRGGNLDIAIELRNSGGAFIASNNPASGTAAQIQTSVSGGLYYLHVRNSGTGSPTNASPSGYTSYGSIGQYFVSGYVAPTSASPNNVQLAATVNNSAWGSLNITNGSFAAGTSVQLTAAPALHHRFIGWTNAVSGSNNPLTIVMQSNTTIHALFAELATTNHSVPHWWLASFGYTNGFEMAAASIGANGIPLWQSYVAGLNPNDPNSRLRIRVLAATGSAPVLEWNTSTGRVYTLWWSTNAPGIFTRVPGASNLAASITHFTNSAAAGQRRVFYRLEAVKP
jgi:hypothetical protein